MTRIRKPVDVETMSEFTIIPVLDLKHGHVVRARAGDRANYFPIVTPLAAGSLPHEVLAGLLSVAPFRSLYIADLDAITGEGDHRAALGLLAREAPQLEIWVDGGYATTEAPGHMGLRGIVPVFGSETLRDADQLLAAGATFGETGFVLSLDYRGGRFMGPAEVEQSVELWPNRVILMTLDRVGADLGPDIDALVALKRRAGSRAIFAAGGVRGEDDLAALVANGISGALVATALHDGRLPGEVVTHYLA
ncbi:MAG: nickel transporter [Rhodospirillales bacterium]|nr:nickel transporter [Rhodospirillales bacterium]